MNFNFELGEEVEILSTSKIGTVISRCEFLDNPVNYNVIYEAEEGIFIHGIFENHQLVKIEQ